MQPLDLTTYEMGCHDDKLLIIYSNNESSLIISDKRLQSDNHRTQLHIDW